jgi:sulfur carrier protein
VQVNVNGAATDVTDGTTVDGLVNEVANDRRSVAVAVNGEVVPRRAWAATHLGEGDSVEILAATAGG